MVKLKRRNRVSAEGYSVHLCELLRFRGENETGKVHLTLGLELFNLG